MRTLKEIHTEIEALSEERTELWHRLSAQHDPEVRAEIHAIDAKLDLLWDEHRAVRARLRFGDREKIVARARVEERLESAEDAVLDESASTLKLSRGVSSAGRAPGLQPGGHRFDPGTLHLVTRRGRRRARPRSRHAPRIPAGGPGRAIARSPDGSAGSRPCTPCRGSGAATGAPPPARRVPSPSLTGTGSSRR